MKTSIQLQGCVPATDGEGNVQKNWSNVAMIYGTLIPVSNTISVRSAGLIDDVDYEFYTKVENAQMIKGNRFIVNNEPLYIEKILDYGKIRVIGLNNALGGDK
jgi:hypothetical protein